eukprot:537095-Pelagomonas_calceolata.AAC.5
MPHFFCLCRHLSCHGGSCSANELQFQLLARLLHCTAALAPGSARIGACSGAPTMTLPLVIVKALLAQGTHRGSTCCNQKSLAQLLIAAT